MVALGVEIGDVRRDVLAELMIDADAGLLGTDTFPSRNAAEPTDADKRVSLADVVPLPRREPPGPTRRRQNR